MFSNNDRMQIVEKIILSLPPRSAVNWKRIASPHLLGNWSTENEILCSMSVFAFFLRIFNGFPFMCIKNGAGVKQNKNIYNMGRNFALSLHYDVFTEFVFANIYKSNQTEPSGTFR